MSAHFSYRLVKILSEEGKSYVVWQEVFDNNVDIPKDTVVNVWKPRWPKELYNITKKGYKAILSSCWYLNRFHFGNDWHQVSMRVEDGGGVGGVGSEGLCRGEVVWDGPIYGVFTSINLWVPFCGGGGGGGDGGWGGVGEHTLRVR